MTNVEYLYQKGKLSTFMQDYARLGTSVELGEFARYYGLSEDNVNIAEWLLSQRKEHIRTEIGTRVFRPLPESNGAFAYGTVVQVIEDNTGEHVLVEWDKIDAFKTMHVIGKDVFAE